MFLLKYRAAKHVKVSLTVEVSLTSSLQHKSKYTQKVSKRSDCAFVFKSNKKRSFYIIVVRRDQINL